VSTKQKSTSTLTLKKHSLVEGAKPVAVPDVKKTLEQTAQEASKSVWDYRLAELRALRRTAGYED
jgi:hypothetical protein